MKNYKKNLFSLLSIFTILIGSIGPSFIALGETLNPVVGQENQKNSQVVSQGNESGVKKSSDENVKKETEVTSQQELPKGKADDTVSSTSSTEENKAARLSKKMEQKKDETEEKEIRDTKKLTILGSTDVHGNVWDYSYEDQMEADLGFARIGTIFKNVKAENPNAMIIDVGDNLQGTLLTDDLYSSDSELLTGPHPIITAMNTIGYTSMTLGNHEFNFGLSLIEKIQKEANFPILSANTYKKGTNENFVQAYTIKEVDGVKVAILGLTIPHIPNWDGDKVASLSFKSMTEEAKKQVKIINNNEKPDVIIAAIHSGLDNSDPGAAARNVITQVPEIDAFFLGHDHREFAEKIKDEKGIDKPVGAVKDTGSGVVRIDLELEQEKDSEEWEIKGSTPSIISSKGVPGDPEVRNATQYAHEKTNEYVNGVVGEASADFLPAEEIPGIPEAQLRPTAMISLINNVQMKVTDADLAASALFKAESRLNQGPIKYSDIFNIYKYPNTLVKAKLNGKQLKDLLEKQAAYYQRYEKGDLSIAFNPKIRVYNYDIISGIKYKIDISKPEGQRITDLTYEGKDIPDTKELTMAMNNYRFEGLAKSGLVDSTPLFESDPATLRGEIVKYIKDKKVIDPEKEIEESFEIIGADLDHPAREYVIEQVKKGTPGFEIVPSADGRTPNVKKLNIDELVSKGLIPDEYLTDEKGDFDFTIMHTNDMHGRMEYDEKGKAIGLAKLKTFKEQQKPTLMVDAGDPLQGLAISNFTKGMTMAKGMSLMPYDGVAVGNHEFDFGYDQAMKYKKELPMLSANTIKDGKASFESYKLVERDGKKFAIIGLTTPETAFKTHPNNVMDVTFLDPIPVAEKLVKELDKKADAFIFLSHLGVDATTPVNWRGDTLAKTLATSFPTKKMVVIDGHSHTALEQGQQFDNVLLVQSGNYLNNVGMVKVSYRGDKPSFKASLIPAADFKEIKPNPEITALIEESSSKFKEEMGKVVIKENPVFFEGDAKYGRTRETNLGNVIADSLYDYGQTGFTGGATDLAVINGGGIRTSINKGNVTKADILAVLPFGNTIAQIDVTGQELKEMFEFSLRSPVEVQPNEETVVLDENGLPALGRNGGFLQVSNSVKVLYDTNLPGTNPETGVMGQRIHSLKIKNRITGVFEDVLPTQTYKLATNDFLSAGGDGYTMLGGKREEGPSMDAIFTEFLQDVSGQAKDKVTSIKTKKYNIMDYAKTIPYSRLIPSVAEEVVTGKGKEELEQKVNEFKKTTKFAFTAHSFSNLENELKLSEKLLATEATEEEFIKQKEKLIVAYNQLVSIKSLLETVAEAKKLVEKEYKKASWMEFSNALTQAQDLLIRAQKVNNVISQKEVNEKEAVLKESQTGLVKDIQTGGTTGKTPGSGSQSNTDKKETGAKQLPKTGEVSSNINILGLIILASIGSFVIYRKKNAA
ncbi:5'-nucleotidase C-terminal domain-containing protein [Vagococcus sp.]|uniref:5'-nucleotidase C-terminal domain-containing protein n=1 Tax=Vagococcus sp. TaxID=1933889 RepID=UPI003F9DBDD1